MLRRLLHKFHRYNPATPPPQYDAAVPFQVGIREGGLKIAEEQSYSSNFAPPSAFGVTESAFGPSATLALKENGVLGLEIMYEPPPGLTPAVDIVFVHGLTGNSYNTWCHSNDLNDVFDVYWPKHLLAVHIPDARILTFGYDADVVGLWNAVSNNRVANHAENLLGDVTRLRERTKSEDRTLLFVMHSLGGLVVQNALDLSRCSPETHLRQFEAKTLGLLFMGTPNFGSNKAKWGNLCATMLNLCKKTNAPIVRVLQPDSELLALIQKKFYELLRLRQIDSRPIQITCFYEELSLPIVGTVVDMKSAVIPGYPSYGIHSNHMGMVRFQGSEDKGYESVSGELLRWCKIARESQSSITELQEECLRCLYFDGLDSREESIISPLPGTFSWVWDEAKCNLPTWFELGRGLYWIQGRASSGKSTLMKYIASTARENIGLLADGQIVVLAYYIDSKNPDQLGGSLDGIVRALLWQLLRQDARYFEFVLPYFEDMKRSRPTFEWRSSVLRSMFSEVLSQSDSKPFLIFLDALDEYSGDLLDIADILNQWIATCSQHVRICFSSRPEQELVLSINSSISVLKLEEHTHDDITMCATQEIERLSSLLGIECCHRLIRCVSFQANGLFMWVKLASRDIVRTCMKGTTMDHKQLLARLNHLPTEVNDLYLQILQRRTDPADYNEALVMLGIVAFGQRSFTLREFSFILQSIGSENCKYNDYENDLMRRRIDSRTGGLLDYQSGRVIFSHGTVSTFVHLLCDQEPQSTTLRGAYQRLSQACLNLLWRFEPSSTTEVRHLPFSIAKHDGIRLQDLQKYAVQHWVHHTTCATMRNMYDSRIVVLPLIRNDQVVHWQRCYLAQCWEYSTTTAPRSSNPITSTLICMLLKAIPLTVFNPNYQMNHYVNPDVLNPVPPQAWRNQLGSATQWKNANLDFLVTIEFATEFTVSFHADDVLNTSLDVINCIVSPLQGGHQNFEQHNDCFYDILHSSISHRLFGDPIAIRPCTAADFTDIPIPKKKIVVSRALLDQIRVILWHYIQMEASKAQDPQLPVNRQLPARDRKRDDTMSFATPVHYAAFFGLDLVVKELHRHGASITYFSEESRYGSPLIAAIWGISERRAATDQKRILEMLIRLDKTRKSLTTPGNAGHLGKVVPLNAAVKLYTNYRRRVGLGSEDLKETISFLLNEEPAVDPVTRVIIRAHSELSRYFASATKPMFTKSLSAFASSAPITIPSPRSFQSSGGCGNASIGGFGNTNINGLMPSGYGPGGPRIIQTLEERF